MQDAYLQAWRELPGLRDTASFDAWLDRIVVNACRMQLRHHRVVRLREIDVAEPADFVTAAASEPPPDEHVADADLVRRAMEHLDCDQRSISSSTTSRTARSRRSRRCSGSHPEP